MGKSDDKAPDDVTHERESSIPFMPEGIGPTIHTTVVHKDDETHTGKGWTEEEANKNAGERYNQGKADK